ncbi:cingulin-like [Anneissia japonica]|uniref:cingulin-like n=1 Tax=Anneissia japonica TaxID=1529436 RepID=UPI00142558EA|nr:cingulin-like [Anneissia japonica]
MSQDRTRFQDGYPEGKGSGRGSLGIGSESREEKVEAAATGRERRRAAAKAAGSRPKTERPREIARRHGRGVGRERRQNQRAEERVDARQDRDVHVRKAGGRLGRKPENGLQAIRRGSEKQTDCGGGREKGRRARDELRRTSRDLAAAKEAEIRVKANHEKIENEIPQWKQWVELKKARDETHESHAKELRSLRDDLGREKSDAETKLATAKAIHSDEIENLRTQISFLTEKESKLRRDAGKFHASLKEREEKHLDRIAKLESDKISRSAEAEEAFDECASLSEKLKLATDSERRSKEDLDRWQAERRSWQATAERRSADLDKLRDLLNTSERERANLESQLSNVDKNVTDSKETDSLKRELERHRQEIRQLERLLSDEKREKSGESNERMISELSKELKTVIDARDRLVKENTEMEKRLSESEKDLSNLYYESMKKVVHLENRCFRRTRKRTN